MPAAPLSVWQRRQFSLFALFFQMVFLVLFSLFCRYIDPLDDSKRIYSGTDYPCEIFQLFMTSWIHIKYMDWKEMKLFSVPGRASDDFRWIWIFDGISKGESLIFILCHWNANRISQEKVLDYDWDNISVFLCTNKTCECSLTYDVFAEIRFVSEEKRSVDTLWILLPIVFPWMISFPHRCFPMDFPLQSYLILVLLP